MFRHSTPIPLRFVDMDAFGHVNNANYLTFFEQARVRYFDDVTGWDYKTSKQGIIMARAEIDFRVPLFFRDEVIVYTRCSAIGTKSLTNEYQMFRRSRDGEVLVSSGRTVAVAFNYDSGTTIPVPESWRKAISQFEGTAL
jgi:acyl-CoA thioester hydrolase